MIKMNLINYLILSLNNQKNNKIKLVFYKIIQFKIVQTYKIWSKRRLKITWLLIIN